MEQSPALEMKIPVGPEPIVGVLIKDYCLTCKPVHTSFPFHPFGFYFTIHFSTSFSIHFHSTPLRMVQGNHFLVEGHVLDHKSIVANVIKEKLFWSDSDSRVVFWFCALTVE